MKLSKKHTSILLIASLFVLTGCEDKGTTTVKEIKQEKAQPAVGGESYERGEIDTHGAKDASAQTEKVQKAQKSETAQKQIPHPMPAAATKGEPHTAVALEILQAAPYVYVKVKEGDKEYWMAAPQANISVGSKVSFNEQMWMQNFTSKTLGRTFEAVMFASSLKAETPVAKEKKSEETAEDAKERKKIETKESTESSDANQQEKTVQPAAKDISSQKNESVPAASGKEEPSASSSGVKLFTVEQLYAQADDLNNTTISVKGKVVKVSEDIMGRNWIHIQDGTGTDGTNDVVFTSPNESAAEGDEVTATGTLKTNIDFGYGYSYAVIIENSRFTK